MTDASRRGRSAAERIRQAAGELFYRQGIRAVGVDAIVHQAGVTKPSLYRNFASKDELAACYLRDYEALFWSRFEQAVASAPGQPRRQILAFFTGLGQRASSRGYRGCGLSNAVIEYPDAHPARQVSEAQKRTLRARLHAMARGMGAAGDDAVALGDGLLLLMEGVYASGQIFGPDGPAKAAARNAERLMAAYLGENAG